MSWHSDSRIVVGVLAGLWACGAAAAGDSRLRGLTLPQALHRLEQRGLRVLYSSELVTDTMRVRAEPAGSDLRSVLTEIVTPYGLACEEGPAGMLVLVRDPGAAGNRGHIVGLLRRLPDGGPLGGALVTLLSEQRRALTDERGQFEFRAVPEGTHTVLVEGGAMAEPLRTEVRVHARQTATLRLDATDRVAADLAAIIVTASRYTVSREPTSSLVTLSGPDLERIPDIGEDPLRTLARLPGLAGSDFSARLNVRGGGTDEVLLRYDGFRLVSPFHMKDFLSPFSVLNPGFVGEIGVHAGGFPVTFGDRMSAVVDIAPATRPDALVREVAVSVFNSALLLAAPQEHGDWLVAARRGNLDLVTRALRPELGRPRYRDFHARLRREVLDDLEVTANLLLLDDDIDVRDGDAEESARARYRDAYTWLRLRHRPGTAVEGDTVFGWTRMRSRRQGSADQPGVGSGELLDRRRFDIASLQTDWSWRSGERALVKLGGEWRHARGRYAYDEQHELELLLDHPGASAEAQRERSLSLRPALDYLGGYGALRLEGPRGLTTEAGLRVDAAESAGRWETRLSPRLALLWPASDRLQLRASWGRFVQTRGIEEIAVPDGGSDLERPQRADHLVLGLDYRAANGVDLRLEAYDKRYRDLRPRWENLLNTFVVLPELKPDRVRIAPERARARGIELSLHRREALHVDWWLSYQLASARDVIGGNRVRRAWDQRHRISAGLVWQNADWEASLAGLYHSGWPTTALTLREGSDPAVVEVDTVNALRLKDYISLDARLARKFRFAGNDRLTLFLEVSNLLYRKNQCCVDSDLDDEAEVPRLDLSIVKARPIVPSIGFVWRF